MNVGISSQVAAISIGDMIQGRPFRRAEWYVARASLEAAMTETLHEERTTSIVIREQAQC